jgi:hypothetical protein
MIGNRRLSGIWALVAVSGLWFLATVGIVPAYAEPPECPGLTYPDGSDSAPTFNTIWKVRQIDSHLGPATDRKFHLCDGDRFVFITSGNPGNQKEFLIPVGSLAARWGSGQLEVKRTTEGGPTGGNRLCVEAMLQGHGNLAPSLHVFKFHRTIAWGPDIDRIQMEIEYDQKKASFNCESENRDTHHGMAHAQD